MLDGKKILRKKETMGVLFTSKLSLLNPYDVTKPIAFLTFNDESKNEVETISAMVSFSPDLGKHFRVAPGASVRDGLLDFSVYPDFSRPDLIRNYIEVMDGGYSGDLKVQHYQARFMKVKTTRKMDLMTIGVLLGMGTSTIKVHQNPLCVITLDCSANGLFSFSGDQSSGKY